MLMALVAIPVMVVLVIGLHEVGHAIAARLCGVKIQTISLGFGKPILRWQGKGCEWIWAIWPLGGYVKLLNSRIAPVESSAFFQCFDKQVVWKRCFILSSGALANAFVALTAFTLFFMLGFKQQLPVVQSVVANSIAAKAGIYPNDQWLAVAGKKVTSWQEVGMQLITHLDQQTIRVRVKNPFGATRDVDLNGQSVLATQSKSLLSALGIEANQSADTVVRIPGVSLVNAVPAAIVIFLQFIMVYCLLIKLLITGVLPFSLLLGPLGLLAVSVYSLAQGLALFLYFIASLSLAVGLVNLLPIPGLDGGSILFAVVEKIRKKPVSIGFEVLLHRLMVIGFSLLFVQLVLNDFTH